MGMSISAYNREDIKASWSYSGFKHFRARLANEIGIDILKMEGYNITLEDVRSGNTDKEGISWDTVDDDIKPFLTHSDCEGDMSPKECKVVGPRIEELVSDWDDNYDYDKEYALELVKIMQHCVDENTPLIFS